MAQSGSEQDAQPAESGDSPPPNNMTMRQLNVPNQSASSSDQRLEIDEWAGEFEGQMRKKLQLAIDKYLADLDASLAAAQKLTGKLVAHVNLARKWLDPQGSQLADAGGHLVDADKTVANLDQKSAGTPYAFIGLQLNDIGLAHIMPARVHLEDAATVTAKTKRLGEELDQGKYHIDRAREKLAALTKQYEDVKRQEKVAEAMEKLAKMHQMFVEDMHAFLKANKPWLNPRDPKYSELSDEEMAELIENLQERFEKLKELMAALAKALADDPELLRRYMAAMRLDADTIRDQLTILARRQRDLREQVVQWNVHRNANRPALRSQFTRRLIRQQIEIADTLGNLHDDVVTWMPRGLQDPALDTCSRLAADVALQARKIVPHLAAGSTDEVLQLNKLLVDRLIELDQSLSAALDVDDGNEKLATYVAARKTQTTDLVIRLSGWAAKVRWLKQEQYGKFVQVDQYRLMTDTVAYGIKIDRVSAMYSSMSDEIAEKAEELNDAVNTEVVDRQVAADAQLGQEQAEESLRAQLAAGRSFADAEKLFDELLTLMEAELAKQPPGTSPPPLPSLEQLLAMLEDEAQACEKLGLAAMLTNLMIQGDLMMPGNGEGGGGGSGKAPSMSSMARQLAEARAQAARAHAKRAAEQMQRIGEQTVPNVELPVPAGSQRDWAKLVSKLRKDFKQTRGNEPPEQYRKAIDNYFKTISQTPPVPAPANDE